MKIIEFLCWFQRIKTTLYCSKKSHYLEKWNHKIMAMAVVWTVFIHFKHKTSLYHTKMYSKIEVVVNVKCLKKKIKP